MDPNPQPKTLRDKIVWYGLTAMVYPFYLIVRFVYWLKGKEMP